MIRRLFLAVLAVALSACASLPARPRYAQQDLARVVPGQTTREQVRQLFGEPAQVYRTRTGFEEWDYPIELDMRLFDFYVDFSDDGVARGAWMLHDPVYDAPSPI